MLSMIFLLCFSDMSLLKFEFFFCILIQDDNEGARTKDDDAFIDDTGVDPENQIGYSDDEAGSIGDAPQVLL